MSATRSIRLRAPRGISRVAVSAALSLCCLLSLLSGATQALCLDFGSGCSPAALPEGPCHDRDSDHDFASSCGSCVDVLVPSDASARCSRPDHEPGPLAASPLPSAAASAAFVAPADAATAAATPPPRSFPLQPFLRTTVLLI